MTDMPDDTDMTEGEFDQVMAEAEQSLPMITGLKLRYVMDYWDGVLAGLADYEDQIVYFEIRDGQDVWDFDAYDVYTYEDPSVEESVGDFERWVGTHQSYHLPREERKLRPRDTWQTFYDKWPPQRGSRPQNLVLIGRSRAVDLQRD